MSQFEFIIPLSKEELLKKRNINDYVVSEVLCSKSLGRLLESKSTHLNILPYTI